jgi:hypothetical protein
MSGDLFCVGVFLLGLFFGLAASPTMDEFRKKRAKERNKPEKYRRTRLHSNPVCQPGQLLGTRKPIKFPVPKSTRRLRR